MLKHMNVCKRCSSQASAAALPFTGHPQSAVPAFCLHPTIKHLLSLAGTSPFDAGKCTAVTQRDKPTDKEVEQLHAKVVAAIETLYYRHRHLVPGFENRPLIIA